MPTLLPLPGELVWIRQQRWRVERAIRDRAAIRLDVTASGRRRTFLAPFDTVLCGPAGAARRRTVSVQEALGRTAGAIARAPDLRLPLALLDADVEIFPHQLEPALAAIAGHSRVLIADEVGLGKTIEAALVIAELLRREAAPRVLVLVPASLRDQWSAELLRRFSIEALCGDRHGLDALARTGAFGANPWQRSGVWLASPDFVKQPQVLDSLPAEPWDLVVIDEAHTVCGDSDRYSACHSIAQRSRRVLLLTATPHSGDAAGFSRLTDLGALAGSAEAPVVFRRTREHIGYSRTRRVRWHAVTFDASEHLALSGLLDFERVALKNAGTKIDNAQLLLSVFRKRALSTFAAFSHSLARRLAWLGDDVDDCYWQQPRLAFDDETGSEGDDLAALGADIGLDSRRERAWLRRLRLLANQAARTDSKVARVCSLVTRTAEPVVVFSEFVDSVAVIEQRLRRCRSVSLLHGGQDATERRRQLRQYLAGPSSVLLTTDVAGQGLNLQSRGRWVISLEVPWNPIRLEQRIGRVDRLGQTRPPHLTVLFARHDAENSLAQHFAQRVRGAQKGFSSDVLRDLTPPDAGSVGRPLRAGDTAGAKAAAYVQTSRYRRSAVIAATSLARRRRLAGCWRGAINEVGRTIHAEISGPTQLAIGHDALAVCSAAVVNRHGELVERLPVALSVRRELMARLSPQELSERIRPIVERVIRRRLARAARMSAQVANRMSERELAIVDLIRHGRERRQGQPGLFDAKALRIFDASVSADRRLEEAGQTEAESIAGSGELHLAAVEIEIVFTRKR